jgi:uncharacterized protein
MDRRISRTLAAAAVALALSAPARAAAPDENARHADIRKLMALTGAGELGVQAARQMLQALRPMVPDAPEAFWNDFASRLDPNDLVEMVIPIYAKHLGPEDVKKLIAFFESPTGRKLTSVQPIILQESMAAGQQWGKRIAEKMVREAKARGFEVKDL